MRVGEHRKGGVQGDQVVNEDLEGTKRKAYQTALSTGFIDEYLSCRVQWTLLWRE